MIVWGERTERRHGRCNQIPLDEGIIGTLTIILRFGRRFVRKLAASTLTPTQRVALAAGDSERPW